MKRRNYFFGGVVGGLVSGIAGTAIRAAGSSLLSGALGGGKAPSTTGGGGGIDPFVQMYSELEESARLRETKLKQATERSGDNSMGELAQEILNSYLETVPTKDRESAREELNRFFIG